MRAFCKIDQRAGQAGARTRRPRRRRASCGDGSTPTACGGRLIVADRGERQARRERSRRRSTATVRDGKHQRQPVGDDVARLRGAHAEQRAERSRRRASRACASTAARCRCRRRAPSIAPGQPEAPRRPPRCRWRNRRPAGGTRRAPVGTASSRAHERRRAGSPSERVEAERARRGEQRVGAEADEGLLADRDQAGIAGEQVPASARAPSMVRTKNRSCRSAARDDQRRSQGGEPAPRQRLPRTPARGVPARLRRSARRKASLAISIHRAREQAARPHDAARAGRRDGRRGSAIPG